MFQFQQPEKHETSKIDLGMAASLMDIYHGDTLPERVEKPLTILLGSKGITEIRNYPNYRVVRSMASPNPTVDLGYRLPWALYAHIVGLFKKVNALHNSEALVYVWEKAGIMTVTIPQQRVSGTSADPVSTVIEPPDQSGWTLWGHIHSHNTMPTFFSGTDDRSETQDGLVYGVIGNITKPMPDSKWRVRAAGQWIELGFDHVVAIPTFPEPKEEWLSRIQANSFRMASTGHGVVVTDRRRVLGRGHVVDAAFKRVIRKDGSVNYQWNSDNRLTVTSLRVEDMTDIERRAAAVEGRDWWPRKEGDA